MGNPVGSFIWYEVMTDQPEASVAFYEALLGWTIVPAAPDPSSGVSDGQAPVDYRMLRTDDGSHAGGMLVLSPAMVAHGGRPGWLSYFRVEDVGAAIAAIRADGGTVIMAPRTLDVGEVALVTDPQAAPFYVMAPRPPQGDPGMTSTVFAMGAMQKANWNEYIATDDEAAKAFYTRHFGYTFDHSMPAPPDRTYWFVEHAGRQIGGLVRREGKDRRVGWMPYFRIADVVNARDIVESKGGMWLSGPHPVPGGDHVALVADPAGAVFGINGGAV